MHVRVLVCVCVVCRESVVCEERVCVVCECVYLHVRECECLCVCMCSVFVVWCVGVCRMASVCGVCVRGGVVGVCVWVGVGVCGVRERV